MWKHETDCVIPLSKTEVLTWPSNGPKIFVSLFQTHRSVSQYLKDLPLHQLFRVANYVLSKVFKGCFYLDVDSKRPSLQISLRKSHPHLLIGLCVLYQRRQWHPTPVLLPGKFHGQRSLVGCSPWGREESDTTERLHFHFSLSCIGEGNGNPLQYSCLENPRDRGAWWAAISGVTQSRTWLKWLSSICSH